MIFSAPGGVCETSAHSPADRWLALARRRSDSLHILHLLAHQGRATDAEVREALAAAAPARKWSTILNGSANDEEEFRKEADAMFAAE